MLSFSSETAPFGRPPSRREATSRSTMPYSEHSALFTSPFTGCLDTGRAANHCTGTPQHLDRRPAAKLPWSYISKYSNTCHQSTLPLGVADSVKTQCLRGPPQSSCRLTVLHHFQVRGGLRHGPQPCMTDTEGPR
ncbi:uncharacterized protein TrAtP1_008124 [Trichoderma atroviride]|uniref:uncharacterized protein n=1 Tax=Hypocrea atroviridis TaxID=63577 RepID=UPI00332563E0|nr:hypothetical protein TrAtP1_008124 [Trichoderma atroviride]